MAQPTQAQEVVAQPPDKDEANSRYSKALMRKRALLQMVSAIKRDIETLPRNDVLVQRSIRVLEYMRGYIKAVDDEVTAAQDNYENAIYAARVEHDAAFKNERKSTLARVRRNPHPAKPAE
jgi:hypothetical protein